MIDAITSKTLTGASTGTTSGTSGDDSPSFDAALKAAQKAEASRQAFESDMDAIKSKGFTTWVRDTQIEQLKQKLREQVMSEMGVDEDSMSKLSSTMQEILQKKIEEEVDRRMQEQQAKDGQTNGSGTTTTTASTQQTGKKDQGGISCPLIPALSWPGGPSVF